MKLGLIGYPLSHSWSPEIHKILIGASYDLIELKKEELPAFFAKRDFDGLNVTIPYKQEVMKYLDETDETAKRIGAVNTIVSRDGKLIGRNTDYIGLMEMIRNAGIDLTDGKCAILGSGGGSKAAKEAVRLLGGSFDIVSRHPQDSDMISYETLYENSASYTCIINTTPVGLSPHMNEMPADPARFENLRAAVDIIANPLRTKFLLEAKKREVRTLGGFEMLVRQAFAADEYFLDTKLDPALIDLCMNRLLSERRNIVIIGMPTSGKSTVSKQLAEMTGKELAEMDAEAEKRLGTSIAACFQIKGEPYFRQLETEIAASLCGGTGKIISCGGGVVKTPETMRLLSHNGHVIWLQRDISQLFATGDRPLSANAADLKKLYEERVPLYSMYADRIIDNTGDMQETLRDLMHACGLAERKEAEHYDVTISKGSLRPAEVRVPSSKSQSHRVLIAAALAEGTGVIHHIGSSEDIGATMDALAQAGAVFEKDGDDLIVHGNGGKFPVLHEPVDARESGTTLRFLIPLFARAETVTVFKGKGRLMERPQSVYEEIFAKQNLRFEKDGNTLTVSGPLKPGVYEADGNISSQFISGLLFTLPLLEEDSEIHVRPPFESSSYIRLTLAALKQAGIEVRQDGLNFAIPGNQTYRACEYTVSSDDSQAAFMACLALLGKVPLEIAGMDHHSLQGDHAIINILAECGAKVSETENGYRFEPAALHAAEIDMRDIPDLGPVLFALATQAEGETHFTGVKRLRMKESDRIAVMEEELRKLGADISSDEDSVTVRGPARLEGGITLDGHNDHRIVMSLAVLAAACEKPLRIHGAEAVRKSWPRFFEDLARTGMKVEYD